MRILALLLAVLIAAPAAAQQRRVPVTEFDRLVVEGPYAVRIVTRASPQASVAGSAAAMDAVSIDQQGTILRIRRNPNAFTARPEAARGPVVVTLSTRTLRSARVIGSGSLDIRGLSGMRVDLALEGNGRLSARDITADVLGVGLAGSGTIEIIGVAERLNADIQGSGSLNGQQFSAEQAVLLAATSGSVTVGARREATVTSNGLGEVVVTGRPACTVRGISAAGVRCGGAP